MSGSETSEIFVEGPVVFWVVVPPVTVFPSPLDPTPRGSSSPVSLGRVDVTGCRTRVDTGGPWGGVDRKGKDVGPTPGLDDPPDNQF